MKKQLLFFIPVLIFISIVILFKAVFFIGYVPTASMAPTLKEGRLIFGMRRHAALNAGDIIVFKHNGEIMVKRIAAVGGQTITVADKIFIIPEDGYFVLGDNLENSFDSRFWENPFVMKSEVIAKI